MGGKIIGAEASRDYERRRTEHRRQWRQRLDGRSGAASPVRRIDPITGRTTILIALKPANLAAGAPTLGTPILGIVPPATVRKRAQRARSDAGDMVLPHPTVLSCDLVDAMVDLHWIGEWDRDDPEAVARGLLAGLRDALG